MLVALAMVHAADPISKQEPALHFLLVYIVLLLTGSGKYSIDGLLGRKKPISPYRKSRLEDHKVAIS